MFKIELRKNELKVTEKEKLTSGASEVFYCEFTFDDEWDGLDKKATFRADGISKTIDIPSDGVCIIPWEVLVRPEAILCVSARGTDRGTLVLPSDWESLGRIEPGSTLGDDAREPTPSIYNRLLELAENASSIAEAIKRKAENGEFDGAPFVYEDFTPEQLALLKGDKGDPFTYSDFTPEQLALLKGDKGDPFTYSDFTPEQLALLKGEDGNIMFATFHVDSNGDLIMTTPDGYAGAQFRLNENYDLEVLI